MKVNIILYVFIFSFNYNWSFIFYYVKIFSGKDFKGKKYIKII